MGVRTPLQDAKLDVVQAIETMAERLADEHATAIGEKDVEQYELLKRLDEANATIATMRDRIDELEPAMDDLREKLSNAEDRNHELERMVSDLERQLEDATGGDN